jgi:hypothetical protein
MEYQFGHENLDVYCLAVGVARWAARQHIPTARRHLRDQLVRAADSVVLNIAEGAGQALGAASKNHYRIAMGSASVVPIPVLRGRANWTLAPIGGMLACAMRGGPDETRSVDIRGRNCWMQRSCR